MAIFTALAIAAIASEAVNARSQIAAGGAAKRAGRAQQDAANSQASLDEQNAAVAEQQATDALARGTEEAGKFRQQINGLISSQKTAAAASNLDVNFGSAVDVRRDAEFLGEQDLNTIRLNAQREAYGYTAEGADLRARARIARKTGQFQYDAGVSAAHGAYASAVAGGFNAAQSLIATRYAWTH